MTKDFADLMHLFACAATDVCIDYDRKYNFEKILPLATMQQVDSIIFPVVEKIAASNPDAYDMKLINAWKKRFCATVSFSAGRNYYMSSLTARLEQKNIKYCILKGQALAFLYKEPECRVSSDVDLWVADEENMSAVIEMLEKDKFVITPNTTESHQTECNHKTFGLIELHTDICDSLAKHVWFDDAIELTDEFIKQKDTYGGEFYTLSVTDGAIFVVFHFIKHFLSHGCGCRPLLDMLLYMRHYHDEIDWGRFNSLFGGLRYLEFIDRCRQVGNIWFGMNFKTETPFDENICSKIMDDIEGGGVFGQSEEYRKEFTAIYTNKRKSASAKHGAENIKYFFTRTLGFIKNRGFNPIRVVKDLKNRNKKMSDNADKLNERVELFSRLGFFDDKSEG